MTRVVIFGDPHLDSGYNLGDPDEAWGNSRLLDARAVLAHICSTPCDLLVFLGDLAANPAPGPAALSVMQEALSQSPANAIALVMGNHDHNGLARSCLDVVAAGLPQDTHVFHHAELVTLAGVQVGALPWAPPQRFFADADSTTAGNQRVADALEDLSRGLAMQLNPDLPSLLGVHWFLTGSQMASGAAVMSHNDPLLSVAEVEASGPWGLVVGGHNHKAQQVGERSWVCGSPMRDSFGEEDLDPGFLVVDFDADGVRVERKVTPDRPLRTIRLEPEPLIAGDDPDLSAVDGAVVRLVGQSTEAQARKLVAADTNARLIDACVMAGAVKIVGPRWDVKRERRARSDLSVDSNPKTALAWWLYDQDLAPSLRDAVLDEAHRIMEAAA